MKQRATELERRKPNKQTNKQTLFVLNTNNHGILSIQRVKKTPLFSIIVAGLAMSSVKQIYAIQK